MKRKFIHTIGEEGDPEVLAWKVSDPTTHHSITEVRKMIRDARDEICGCDYERAGIYYDIYEIVDGKAVEYEMYKFLGKPRK